MSPQSSRQVEVKDYYFDENGFYLGKDDRPTNYVRIIYRNNWILWGGKNGKFPNIEDDILSNIAPLLSEASEGMISSDDVLKIYDWVNNKFNIINMPISINNTTMMAFMRTGVEYNKSIVFDSFLEINHNKMVQRKFCDNIYDIASIMRHEAGHDFTWRNNPWTYGMTRSQKELAAYEYQMYGNSIWGMTSPQLQAATISMYVYYLLVSASNWPLNKN